MYFDQLKRDEGYAGVIENSSEEMICSHQVKRFFKGFSWLCGGMFRRILKRLLIWRLKMERPEEIELTHFPQLVVHKGQNSGGCCLKVVEYQPPFFEIQM